LKKDPSLNISTLKFFFPKINPISSSTSFAFPSSPPTPTNAKPKNTTATTPRGNLSKHARVIKGFGEVKKIKITNPGWRRGGIASTNRLSGKIMLMWLK
jgi:hypothetical protein